MLKSFQPELIEQFQVVHDIVVRFRKKRFVGGFSPSRDGTER
jgi:hypothetical protein